MILSKNKIIFCLLQYNNKIIIKSPFKEIVKVLKEKNKYGSFQNNFRRSKYENGLTYLLLF